MSVVAFISAAVGVGPILKPFVPFVVPPPPCDPVRSSIRDVMLEIRSYNPSDAPELLDLFRRTIREVNSADYNPLQIAAWASDEIDIQDWHNRFAGRFAYVAMFEDRRVGFADMTTTGYLDRLFVSAQYQRRGVAKALLAKLKADAREAGIAEMVTEASITAKPFFEASGFAVIRDQTVECRGVEFTNYRMGLRVEGE